MLTQRQGQSRLVSFCKQPCFLPFAMTRGPQPQPPVINPRHFPNDVMWVSLPSPADSKKKSVRVKKAREPYENKSPTSDVDYFFSQTDGNP